MEMTMTPSEVMPISCGAELGEDSLAPLDDAPSTGTDGGGGMDTAGGMSAGSIAAEDCLTTPTQDPSSFNSSSSSGNASCISSEQLQQDVSDGVGTRLDPMVIGGLPSLDEESCVQANLTHGNEPASDTARYPSSANSMVLSSTRGWKRR